MGGAPKAVVFHAVEALTVAQWRRANRRWQDLPLMLKAQPSLRRYKPLGIFWTWRHMRAWIALAGVLAWVGRPSAAGLALPYLYIDVATRRGRGPKALIVALFESPTVIAGDAVELVQFARGSIRHRSALL
jgi:hypothetical protein